MKLYRNVKLLMWLNFFSDFRLYSIIAIIYFSHITGSYALGLSVFSVSMIASAFLELPTGILSDKIGRKMTIVFGSMASIIALTSYAVGGHYLVLVLGAVFEGLGRSFFSGNNEAFLHNELAEHGEQEQFGEVLGKVSSMSQFALSISAVLGGLLATKSLVFVMQISVIPQIIGLVISLFMSEPKTYTKPKTNAYVHLKESFKLFLQNPKLRLLNLATITSYGIGETMFQFNPVFIAMVWPIWALGIFRFLDNAFAAIGFWFSGKLMKKYEAVKSLIAGKFLSGFLGITAVAYPTVISPVPLALTSIFFGWGATARTKLMQQEYSNAHRATMGSLASFAGSIFMGIFGVLFGIVADKIGPVKSILIGEILVFATVVFYFRLSKYYSTTGLNAINL